MAESVIRGRHKQQLALLILAFQVCSAPIVQAAEVPRCKGDWVAKAVSVQGTVEVKVGMDSDWRTVELEQPFCGGEVVRVLTDSRAALLLRQDATNLQLDENSTLTLPPPPSEVSRWVELLKGAVHFLSRTPTSLKVKTPFLNAHIEGTEFMVRTNDENTRVLVFSGKVLAENLSGQISLESGQQAVATANEAPRRYLLVQPRDSVAWALYYPPLIDWHADGLDRANSAPVRNALSLYRAGKSADALVKLEAVPEHERDLRFRHIQAGLLLSVGRVENALSVIDAALKTNAKDGIALALKAMTVLVRGDKLEALTLATRATDVEPGSSVPWVALSYVQQALFELKDALINLEKAKNVAPENALVYARLAEMELARGELDSALNAAERASTLAPSVSRTQTVLGFVRLAQLKASLARIAFKKAIGLDPSDPLARLGKGLANIREGKLKEGVRELEISAILDPNNALVRSYLGKGYYEQKRSKLASAEYETAQALDPNDPTPWFYNAINKQANNRPIEGFHDLQKAIKLNNNRAVYRSRLMLDEDLASRGVALGRIYTNIGFAERGLVEAWTALAANPTDYTAHRLLADTYSVLPRHQPARVSELLQSQLLQPINATPIQPQLAESDLIVLGGLGAAEPSLNEFNALFQRPRLHTQISGLVATQNTFADEAVHSGFFDRFSYSLGQYHYQTSGYRPNNDYNTNIYNIFTQAQLSQAFIAQLELRNQTTETGDLRETLFPEFISNTFRQKFDRNTGRIGLKIDLSPTSKFIGNLSYRDLTQEKTTPADIQDARTEYLVAVVNGRIPLSELEQSFILNSFPLLASRITAKDKTVSNIGGKAIELQLLKVWPRLSLRLGGNLIMQDFANEDKSILSSSPIISGPFRNRFPKAFLDYFETAADRKTSVTTTHASGYFYTDIRLLSHFMVSLGGELHFLDRDRADQGQDLTHLYFNPKIGLMWQPGPDTVFRAAWIKNVSSVPGYEQTIEPTHIFGINQLYRDEGNSRANRYAVAIDQRLSSNTMTGFEVSWREVATPTFSNTGPIIEVEQNETAHRMYFDWAISDRITTTVEYFFEEARRTQGGLEGIDGFEWHRLPVSVNWFHPEGWFSRVNVTYSKQAVESDEKPDSHSQFVTVDLKLGYRLPKRFGIITVGVKNIFDTEFLFQNPGFLRQQEPDAWLYVPERQVYGQLTLAF